MHATSSEAKESSNAQHRNILVAIGCLGLFSFLTTGPVVDLDMWHQMALARELFAQGHIPWKNTASFVPSIEPVVHHEWGAGVVAYALGTWLGAMGLALLRCGLIWALAVVVWQTSRRRGASIEILSFVVPLVAIMVSIFFSPIRAQLYTFLLLAILLDWLDRGRLEQSWRWVGAWFILYVLWLNLHAGFLVGAGLFFLYWFERVCRGLPHRGLLFTGLAMIPLILVNPYGFHYVDYLINAVALDRTYIIEWQSTWAVGDVILLTAFGISIALFAYAIYCQGFRKAIGFPLVVVTLVTAMFSIRMVPLYAITWMVFVPGWLAHSRLEQQLQSVWDKMSNFLPALWLHVAIVCWSLWLIMNPFVLKVPGELTSDKKSHRIYPVGAVNYLKSADVPTNLIVPFEVGAYVSWKLPELVKVSMDSRYEAAYPPESADEHFRLYRAEAGWQDILHSLKNCDAILVPKWTVLAEVVDQHQDQSWRLAYHDAYYSIYAKKAHPLPVQDELGVIPEDTIP